MTFPFHFIFDLLRAELNLGFGRAKIAKKKKKKEAEEANKLKSRHTQHLCIHWVGPDGAPKGT